MGFYDILRKVAAGAGVSFSELADRIGKNRNYVTSNASRGSLPRIDNAAAMLGACGWSLVVVPSDDVPPSALVIEPPEPDQDAERRALERRRDKLRRELAATEQLLG